MGLLRFNRLATVSWLAIRAGRGLSPFRELFPSYSIPGTLPSSFFISTLEFLLLTREGKGEPILSAR
jgi:hypothetical protein